MSFDIEAVATSLLSTSTDDYASRIWEAIKDDVVEDVLECADEHFSEGDVALAIGRAIAKQFGFEV